MPSFKERKVSTIQNKIEKLVLFQKNEEDDKIKKAIQVAIDLYFEKMNAIYEGGEN